MWYRQTPRSLQRCLLMTTDPGDLVLDPTCGSGTTAYVAEQWGRRWITVRHLAAWPSPWRAPGSWPPATPTTCWPTRRKARKRRWRSVSSDFSRSFGETTKVVTTMTMGDIRKGFVYKRVPHVTLKSIANNEEIDAIHARWQAQLEPLRAEINRLAGKDWEEWQVPRELTAKT